MPRFLFDYMCCDCGEQFEELVDRDNPDPVKCPTCDQLDTKRLTTWHHIDPKLGIQSGSFPTMGDKWARIRRQRQKIEAKRDREHGS